MRAEPSAWQRILKIALCAFVVNFHETEWVKVCVAERGAEDETSTPADAHRAHRGQDKSLEYGGLTKKLGELQEAKRDFFGQVNGKVKDAKDAYRHRREDYEDKVKEAEQHFHDQEQLIHKYRHQQKVHHEEAIEEQEAMQSAGDEFDNPVSPEEMS
eukprot:CAMPEP_0197634068 /NCGR_PEP_ID=MMETSP1338-20131121/10277_1 /TAXON_ID=43686 ORGANISM="Pelagodinium beii, Strain RCC1491" /NCGR_SAMPLE_ID=MMETSP1338 /ASSEMBLY_ACC=CAM_ASM_000754 /LENGTH=156 /DNA_ID=CAMNT_0043205867 /DNA_START=1 /DNA_END=471 /DNA_ORIENTATION=+